MLFYGARTDVQLFRDIFVAAPLHEELQNLLVTIRDLDVVQVQHSVSLLIAAACAYPRHPSRSPILRANPRIPLEPFDFYDITLPVLPAKNYLFIS